MFGAPRVSGRPGTPIVRRGLVIGFAAAGCLMALGLVYLLLYAIWPFWHDHREEVAFRHLAMAHRYDRAGQADAAVREYEAAVEADPLLSDAHDGLARIYRRRGQLERAATEYRAIIAQRNKLGDTGWPAIAHFELGQMLDDEGRRSEARAEWQRALDLANRAAPQRSIIDLRAKAAAKLRATSPHA